MTARPSTVRARFARLTVGVAATALLAVGAAGPAAALPPDGAGPDTPGTSVVVTPKKLKPCATISFTLNGFPAGETVYLKIDDGAGSGDSSVQGSGVVHQQAIPSSGRVKGSFELPCKLKPGKHWLRFLASKYVDASDPGKGTLGYTLRSPDFTVVKATKKPAKKPSKRIAGTVVAGG